MKRISFVLGVWATAHSFGCTEVSQQPVEYDAVAVFDGAGVVQVATWSLELTRAELAFGPVYFCASASGSSALCESATAEVTSIARLDALSSVPSRLGRVDGFTGSIRSAAYDYGITWFDTETEPNSGDALSGGHSLHLEGEARQGTVRVPFSADVDLTPQYAGQTAVPTAVATADVTSPRVTLEVHFDVRKWLLELDRNDAGGGPYLDSLLLASPGGAVMGAGSFGAAALLVGIKNLNPPEFRWVSEVGP